MNYHPPAPLIWLTGLSGAGKTTIARALGTELEGRGVRLEILDGDEIRSIVSPDLGFSRADRDLQVRRIGYIAQLLTRNGVAVAVSAISPYRDSRAEALSLSDRSFEIFVRAPLEVLFDRDTKGLYAKAAKGEISGLTGVDDPYEAPDSPDLVLDTSELDVEECLARIFDILELAGGQDERTA